MSYPHEHGRKDCTGMYKHPRSQVQVKKIELPYLEGPDVHRKFPEFKAVFRHLADETFDSEIAKAYELKRHVKAPADQLIASVAHALEHTKECGQNWQS